MTVITGELEMPQLWPQMLPGTDREQQKYLASPSSLPLFPVRVLTDHTQPGDQPAGFTLLAVQSKGGLRNGSRRKWAWDQHKRCVY